MAERWAHIRTVEGDHVPEHTEIVHIAAIGDMFLPGTREALAVCAGTALRAGYDVGLEIVKNLSIRPNEGVPAMRNMAAMSAMERRADWLFMVDNDFLLDDPMTLVKLLSVGKLAVCPFYDQSPVHGKAVERISDPMLQPGQGLVPIQWVAINCILFSTVVLRLVGTELFTGPLITNKEEYVFLRLRNAGVQLWQDTDVAVKMLRAPTRVWANLGQANPNPATDDNRDRTADNMETIKQIAEGVASEG